MAVPSRGPFHMFSILLHCIGFIPLIGHPRLHLIMLSCIWRHTRMHFIMFYHRGSQKALLLCFFTIMGVPGGRMSPPVSGSEEGRRSNVTINVMWFKYLKCCHGCKTGVRSDLRQQCWLLNSEDNSHDPTLRWESPRSKNYIFCI